MRASGASAPELCREAARSRRAFSEAMLLAIHKRNHPHAKGMGVVFA
jgi:hypothetical protein